MEDDSWICVVGLQSCAQNATMRFTANKIVAFTASTITAQQSVKRTNRPALVLIVVSSASSNQSRQKAKLDRIELLVNQAKSAAFWCESNSVM